MFVSDIFYLYLERTVMMEYLQVSTDVELEPAANVILTSKISILFNV